METCPRCGERFADVAALVDHVERVHERGGGRDEADVVVVPVQRELVGT